jgi:hypothetical protein
MKLLNMAMVRNFEVMLRQTLNHSVELDNCVHCYIHAKRLTCYIMQEKQAKKYYDLHGCCAV